MRTEPQIAQVANALRAAHAGVMSRRRASHEDIRDHLLDFLGILGYERHNRYHEQRIPGTGRLDVALTTDFGDVVFVLEIKTLTDTFSPAQLRDYLQELRVGLGVFTNGQLLQMYRLEGADLRGVGGPVHLGHISDDQARLVTETLKKPQTPLSSQGVSDYLGRIAGRRLGLHGEYARTLFLDSFRLPDAGQHEGATPFGMLVECTIALFAETAADRDSYTRRAYELWRHYFAAERVADAGTRRRWQDLFRHALQQEGLGIGDAGLRHLRSLGSDDQVMVVMFALETAYALAARFLLAIVCEDFGLSRGLIAWLSRRCQDADAATSERGPFLLWLATGLGRDLFDVLALVFPTVFEPDFFDWWTDSFSRLTHAGIARGEASAPAIGFSRAVLSVMLAACQFSFAREMPDVLSSLYQQYFDVRTRKALGEFYTAGPIVTEMLDRVGYLPGQGIATGKILIDPACGSGTFLREAVLRYLDETRSELPRGRQARIARLKQALEGLCDGLAVCGLDINPFAVLISRVNFARACPARSGRLGGPSLAP